MMNAKEISELVDTLSKTSNKSMPFNSVNVINNSSEMIDYEEKCKNIVNAFKEQFAVYTVRDWTELDRRTYCEIKVLLHENQELLDDDKKLLEKLGGKRKDLRIFFSFVSDISCYFIEQTEYDSKNRVWKFTRIEESELDFSIREQLATLIQALGYRNLELEVAKYLLPEVETEFVDQGKVTIFHCLFTDMVELFGSKIVYE